MIASARNTTHFLFIQIGKDEDLNIITLLKCGIVTLQ